MFETYKAEIMLAIKVLVIVGAFGAGVYVTRDHYLADIRTMEANYQAAYSKAVQLQLDEIAAHQADLIKGETQHAKDQLVLGSLGYQLAGMQHASGICGGAAAKADAASANRNRAGGVLPNRVDAAFGSLQTGIDRIVERCDQLNIDARQHNVEVGNAP